MIKILSILRDFVLRLIEFELRWFLGEEKWSYLVFGSKEEVIWKLKILMGESARRRFFGRHKKRDRFFCHIDDTSITLSRKPGLVAILGGATWYFFQGVIGEDHGRCNITGRYRTLPAIRVFCLIWLNGIFLWAITGTAIVFSTMFEQEDVFRIHIESFSIIFFGSILLLAGGRFVVWLIMISEYKMRQEVQALLQSL